MQIGNQSDSLSDNLWAENGSGGDFTGTYLKIV